MRTTIIVGLWFLGSSITHFTTPPSVDCMMVAVVGFCILFDTFELFREEQKR